MSDTPRTKAHIAELQANPEVSGCDKSLKLIEQLETELNEAVDLVDGMRLGKYFHNGAMVLIFLKKHGRIKYEDGMSDKTNDRNIEAMRLRMAALYHTCLSSAAFRREDACRCEDEKEAATLRGQACAYQVVAVWIDSALDSFKAQETKGGGE